MKVWKCRHNVFDAMKYIKDIARALGIKQWHVIVLAALAGNALLLMGIGVFMYRYVGGLGGLSQLLNAYKRNKVSCPVVPPFNS